ncbi:aspartate/glutamate racemase family protein [Mesorhizobium sp. B3-1-3]|uniref:aspartate/glutamate racemase family protein n=1 Tax=unclassified Mesorhizobium TaxID=325217 RepID=UPI0011272375|nr:MULTISPECIES: aspartate/glutamate racemase family protein [unclassified Mesorhizobium]TPI60430.1 aspartate/glutamate racemase family protein [Mesorhizobium sp. B3-1-3]TPI68567.1 aspartate/glutamate racemase family protein [Mesorhizobium sp. B3-1-8]
MTARDSGIQRIHARKNHSCYGMGLGIIILDEVYPGFPGDVRNASAYPFPIQYEIAEGVDIQHLVRGDDKKALLKPIVRAARKLERMGCRAIAAECGYFAWFQKEIAASVDVPVFASSLLQVPLAQMIIGPERVVGILVAEGDRLSDRHLTSVGVTLGTNYIVHGAKDDGKTPQFDNLWTKDIRPEIPTADYDLAERDIVKVAKDFAAAHSDMGAMVLECTGFQPFGRAIQREIDMPVFSWSTLLDYAYSVAVHRDFYGHV